MGSLKKRLVYSNNDTIPLEVLRNNIYNSEFLEELHIMNSVVIPNSHVLSLEKLNLIYLKILNIVNCAYNQKVLIRLIVRCRNLEDIRISCLSTIDHSTFYKLRERKHLKKLTLNTNVNIQSSEAKMAHA